MSQGKIYNAISILFLGLSLCVCLVTVAWVSDAVAVPDFLSPATDIPIPPTVERPGTWTPTVTLTPTRPPLATWTPEPSLTPAPTQ